MNLATGLLPANTHRVPLRTEQHILFLLLTVFTGGLLAPLWLIRIINGNREAD